MTLPSCISGTPKRLREARLVRRGVVQEKRLARRRDDAGHAAADGNRAARLVGRSSDRGAHAEQVALAQEDRRRIGAVGGLEEDPEELGQQRRQAALLEGRARDALERDQAPRGLVALARAKLDVARAKLLALAEEVREGLDACAQDVRVVRLGDVVGGAAGVALARVPLVAMNRRQEDDRHLAPDGRGPDAGGDLEAVHLRHLHVEEDRGERPLDRPVEGLAARARQDELEPQRPQDGLEGDEVRRRVVDEQDAGEARGRRGRVHHESHCEVRAARASATQ